MLTISRIILHILFLFLDLSNSFCFNSIIRFIPVHISVVQDKEAIVEMSGREIVNLIEKLQEKGMSGDEIIEIILYIEKRQPEKD